jgi:outer membrane protein TolC
MLAQKTRVLSILVILLAFNLRVQSEETEILTLNQCLAVALSQNPLILSAIHSHQASVARIDQATSFPVPSIDFESDVQPQPLNFVRAEEAYLGASQTFEFPGKRALRGKIADRESHEIQEDIELLKLDIAFWVKEAFYSLLLAQEQMRYSQRDRELSEEFLNNAELKQAAGDVARVEVLRARVEALRAANAVKVAANNVSLAKARLNYLLARGKYAPLQIAGDLGVPFIELDLEQLKQEAVSLRPEIKRISFSMEREEYVKDQARLSNYPDFDVGVSYHYMKDLPTSWAFSVSVPLPFLFKKQQKAEFAEAQANLSALDREAENLRNAIQLEVEESYMNSLTAKNQIQLLRDEILPQAEEVYDMLFFSYQEGEIGGIDLIESRRTLNEARKSYADALFEYARDLAVLERAVGRQP